MSAVEKSKAAPGTTSAVSFGVRPEGANEPKAPDLATIYLPDEVLANPKSFSKGGLLIGFNFSGFLFVVTKVVPRDQFKTLQHLQVMVANNKQKSFNWYCAGSPMILGVLETTDSGQINNAKDV